MAQPPVNFAFLEERNRRAVLALERATGRASLRDDPETIRAVADNAPRLGDVFNTSLLPIAKELRREGVDPDAISLIVGDTSSALPEYNFIILDWRKVESAALGSGSMYDAEDLYVGLSHELGHFLHERSMTIPHEEALFYYQTLPIHADRPNEHLAFYWEGEQARRFGWSKTRYERHLRFAYPKEGGLSALEREARTQFMELTSPSRRPDAQRPHAAPAISPDVHVKRHRRGALTHRRSDLSVHVSGHRRRV